MALRLPRQPFSGALTALLLCRLLSGYAAPRMRSDILVVDAGSPGVRETIGRHGLRVFGLDETWVLLEDDPIARSVLGTAVSHRLAADGREGLYLVYSQSDEPAAVGSEVLLRAEGVSLVQMTQNQALLAAQLGGDLVRLPSEPHPYHVPEPRFLSLPDSADTMVQRVVSEVTADSIHEHIWRLQRVQTRYSPAESCRAAEQHLYDYFVSLGFDEVELDTYAVSLDTWRNVVATRTGRVHPDKILIVCGHMDAISEDPWVLAPGAEDDGSGTAMAIEAGRVLVDEDLDCTVKFVAFTGEETGLYGSAHYAQMMRELNADIIGVINFDMVAWPGGRWGVRLVGLPDALWLVLLQARMADLYTSLDHSYQVRSFPSDSRSFEEQGYVATSGYEYGTEPYIWYHTTADTLGNLSMPLAREVCQMAVATLVTVAQAPQAPQRFRLADVGTGRSLMASWEAGTEPDLAGYVLRWGAVSRLYTDSVVLGLEQSYVIHDLVPDTVYFATVSPLDSSGFEGHWSVEDSAVPRDVPQRPSRVEAWPATFSIDLSWAANTELDLAGYNLYRSTVSGSGYELLNHGLVQDTVFNDSGLMSDTMYYYVATAVDTGGNESGYSDEVRGKPVTLDHGILLVDETRDGNGRPGSPSDEQQDGFYHAALEGFDYTDWDVAEQGIPAAADIGPFSTIVWHGDEYGQVLMSGVVDGLANHLSHGGRLWLVGWKPAAALAGGIPAYPYEFGSGDFAFDHLGISRAEQSAVVDFTGGSGHAGFPDLALDSAKVLPAMRGRLPYIDALLPGAADTILRFVSSSGDTFDGKPVGVRWTEGQGRAVAFGFPFYYAKDDEARSVARRVLEDLGEPYAIAEDRGHVPRTELFGVWPKPCRGIATVSFSLSRAQYVDIAVFDAAGKRVSGLMQGVLPAGRHNAVWDGRLLGTGVYFFRLVTDDRASTTKTELVR
ncbi:MAG: M20/M25/M40 family metallo-hydrolase [candidate division WOR-3 bacterium]|nr:MAG: M20/M25/M40 family metallo-hydrolase [candidate division WOR-3 bacterium]